MKKVICRTNSGSLRMSGPPARDGELERAPPVGDRPARRTADLPEHGLGRHREVVARTSSIQSARRRTASPPGSNTAWRGVTPATLGSANGRGSSVSAPGAHIVSEWSTTTTSVSGSLARGAPQSPRASPPSGSAARGRSTPQPRAQRWRDADRRLELRASRGSCQREGSEHRPREHRRREQDQCPEGDRGAPRRLRHPHRRRPAIDVSPSV